MLFAVFLLVLPLGCCSRRNNASAVKEPLPTTVKGSERDVQEAQKKNQESGGQVEKSYGQDPDIQWRKRSQAIYRRLEHSFDRYQKNDLDGALREVEIVQREAENDPYLEMQTWYLSAMIHHKSGKTSRRKRAMRKMLETMEQLQQDPRFRKSFEEGMSGQELIEMALKKGEGRYAE